MSAGTLNVLSVADGDMTIKFDSNNPSEVIRARRIITDMIKRGYALLIELPDGTHTRALEFDPKTDEYIIADFDEFHIENTQNPYDQPTGKTEAAPEKLRSKNYQKEEPTNEKTTKQTPKTSRSNSRTKRVKAEKSTAYAVAPTAGG